MPWDNGAGGRMRPQETCKCGSPQRGCSEAKQEEPPAPSPWFPWFPSLLPWELAMHSSCAGGDRLATMLPTTPDLLQPPRNMCLNAKVTHPSVFEALWGKAVPALAGAGYWLHLFLAADSRSIPAKKRPFSDLKKTGTEDLNGDLKGRPAGKAVTHSPTCNPHP